MVTFKFMEVVLKLSEQVQYFQNLFDSADCRVFLLIIGLLKSQIWCQLMVSFLIPLNNPMVNIRYLFLKFLIGY